MFHILCLLFLLSLILKRSNECQLTSFLIAYTIPFKKKTKPNFHLVPERLDRGEMLPYAQLSRGWSPVPHRVPSRQSQPRARWACPPDQKINESGPFLLIPSLGSRAHWWCSGVISDPALRNHSWWLLGTLVQPGWAVCETNSLLAVSLLWFQIKLHFF